MDKFLLSACGGAFVIVLLTAPSVCGDKCYDSDGSYEYCSNGCCGSTGNQYCCVNGYMIAGIVFGCIAGICLITAITCCVIHKCNQSKRSVSQGPTATITYITPATNPAYSNPGMYGPPPPTHLNAPPGYDVPSAPPPAYNYVNPYTKGVNPSPFAVAAGSPGGATTTVGHQ